MRKYRDFFYSFVINFVAKENIYMLNCFAHGVLSKNKSISENHSLIFITFVP